MRAALWQGLQSCLDRILEQAARRCREKRWLQMSDPYFEAIQEQWPNIRALYKTYASEKPIILYDIEEEKIYAYPYKEFKAEMSQKSQVSLERDYMSASVHGSIIVFVRDNVERRLVSYTMTIDDMRPVQ